MSLVCETVGEAMGGAPDHATLFSAKERNVSRSVAAARQFAHYTMHETLGYSVTFIARTTNTTRANVFSNVRKCRQMSELYPDYTAIKNKIENKIKEMQP